MKKQLWIRGISLLLAFLILFGATACARGTVASEPKEEIRLTVEETPVQYTDAFSEQSARRATEILSRLLFLNEGLLIPESEKEALMQRIRNDYLPLFSSQRVREEELERVLERSEYFCDRLESASATDSKRTMLLGEWYRDMVAALGTERAGHVMFFGICFYLDEQIHYFEEQYDRYGFSFYQMQADLLKERKSALTDEIGADVFAKAMTVPAFLSSVAAGALWVEDEQLSSLLYDGDLVAILRRQGDYFTSLGISEYQWILLGEVFSLFGSDGGEDLLGEEICILRDLGVLSDGAACIPNALRLYSAFVDRLDAKTLAAIRDGADPDAQLKVFCSVLAECKDEMLALMEKFEMMCKTSALREFQAIENAELLEEFAAFENEYSMLNAEKFFEVISKCAEGSVGSDEVYAAAIGYLRSTAPYLAFAIDSSSNR